MDLFIYVSSGLLLVGLVVLLAILVARGRIGEAYAKNLLFAVGATLLVFWPALQSPIRKRRSAVFRTILCLAVLAHFSMFVLLAIFISIRAIWLPVIAFLEASILWWVLSRFAPVRKGGWPSNRSG